MRNIPAILLIVVPSLAGLRTVYAEPQTRTITPEQMVELAKTMPPGTKIGIRATNENAEGTGPGLDASGEKIDLDKFKADAPTATLGKDRAGAKGGSVDAALSVIGGGGPSVPIIAAVLFFIGAGVAAYLRNARAAMIAAGIGGVFLVAALYPAMTFILIAGAGVALLGVWLKSEHDKNTAKTKADAATQSASENKEAGRAMASALATAPQRIFDFVSNPTNYGKLTVSDIRAIVSETVKEHADNKDRVAISKIKAEDGLP